VKPVSSRQTGRDAGRGDIDGDPGAARAEPDEAAEVLRGVWSASGQTAADLDELFGPAKSCKNMRDVGFDGLAVTGGDLRAAWRATLRREGKLSDRSGSIADLMFGAAEPGHQ
jgi:hypothetical protein